MSIVNGLMLIVCYIGGAITNARSRKLSRLTHPNGHERGAVKTLFTVGEALRP